ncbi:glycosyltransferase family 2 protein [Aliamphritea spongicola]|uniref:glycosyltransferase family 2 protein n=1 Tax=Aliamphritea spongicola TaxID=707589 RepID=UPI00196B2482|nr:glycosyltransferase family 2 protein [Aliamphritea spongicola]MBN3560853.1 glycosyltransferase family 2 protein [Aliamphritea spongicola]
MNTLFFTQLSTLLFSLLAICWGLIIYHHLLYPWLLGRLGSRNTRRTVTEPATSNWQPTISLVIPAYNEAAVIADKIRNVASLDYPADKLQLIIACDGCSDATADIARRTAREAECRQIHIHIEDFQENRGKVAVLNDIISQLDCDIVALSDASALISIDALLQASQAFQNNQTGFVAATYKLLNPGSQGEADYWQYQTRIKCNEANIGSPVGVHGALYFFRRKLFSPLPADTINDDFILPMQMVMAGYKGVYLLDIVALELEEASLQMDEKRRVRIAAGNLQQLLRLARLTLPRYKGTAFTFTSGKALRALMPAILALQWVLCCLLAAESQLLLALSILQPLGFACAALSKQLPAGMLPGKIETLFYLANGYRASFTGMLRYCIGLERGCWKPVSKDSQ